MQAKFKANEHVMHNNHGKLYLAKVVKVSIDPDNFNKPQYLIKQPFQQPYWVGEDTICIY
jgi:hypothetical protein